MGTRGVYGFRVDGVDKVTYNHFDSYPSHLGKSIADFVRSHSNDYSIPKLREIAKSIILVEDNSFPSKEQVEKFIKSGFYNDSVSTGQDTEWYCLLRETQGDLDVYNDGELNVMIDNSGCMGEDSWCEWAYIINLDDNVFEMYCYGSENECGDESRYKGWGLLAKVDLDELEPDEIENYEEENDEGVEVNVCELSFKFTIDGDPTKIQDKLNDISIDMTEKLSEVVGELDNFSCEVNVI